MQRTQIYLEPELNDALGRMARKRGQTKAEIIRRAVWRFLEQEQGGGCERDHVWRRIIAARGALDRRGML